MTDTKKLEAAVEAAEQVVKDAQADLHRARTALYVLRQGISRAKCADEGHDWHPPSRWFSDACKRCGCLR